LANALKSQTPNPKEIPNFKTPISRMSQSDKTPPADIAEGAERAAAKVPDKVDRAGDNTPTKPGTEAIRASSGTADHPKHPPGERAESAEIAITGDENQNK
jgi:hypothetical protein